MARIQLFLTTDPAVRRIMRLARSSISLRPFPPFPSCFQIRPRCYLSFIPVCSIFTFYAHLMEMRRPILASEMVGLSGTRLKQDREMERDANSIGRASRFQEMRTMFDTEPIAA